MHNPRVKKWVKNEGVTIFGMQSYKQYSYTINLNNAIGVHETN
ncbi:MAG: hypothetical protein PHN71_00480 [Candidatus Cloacimonetes bacterium]|nr:hypothetical protein [Candidatus Cloacimonadota bacterium]MDD4231968.1 hypothetical protein [Candidatus Cloacimonadota bacterium]